MVGAGLVFLKKNKKKQIYKPNSVLIRALIIYLDALLPVHSSCLPSNIARAALKRWFT